MREARPKQGNADDECDAYGAAQDARQGARPAAPRSGYGGAFRDELLPGRDMRSVHRHPQFVRSLRFSSPICETISIREISFKKMLIMPSIANAASPSVARR